MSSNGSERCISERGASANESKTSRSSIAVSSGTTSSSKERVTAASRHRKTTTDAVGKQPARLVLKRSPKKTVKSSVKGRYRPPTSLPQPGEKLPVEIVFTRSSVDVMWQVSLDDTTGVNRLVKLIV